jgi:very-short-patch-repair endonuclease
MKRTTESFIKEVEVKFGDEYEVLGEYTNTNTKITMKHKKCGNIFEAHPSRMINRGHGCPKCAIIKVGNGLRKTIDTFKDDVMDILGPEYEVLGDYKNNKTPILMRHKKCGFEYEPTPVNILKGHGCPKCAGLIKKSTEDFKAEVFNLVGDEYSVLSDYVNCDSKIKMRHLVCDSEYKVSPTRFLSGDRCPICNGKFKKSTKEFKEEVFNLIGDEYSVLEDYTNTHTKIGIKHNKCGNIYDVSPTRFLSGDRCPICKSSKGENKISEWLENRKIQFEREFSFEDLKFINPLRFDFFLSDSNTLIEYDGEFHYEPIFGLDKLSEQKYNDHLKDEYCKQKGIKLIRIPYWNFNKIEQILENIIEL